MRHRAFLAKRSVIWGARLLLGQKAVRQTLKNMDITIALAKRYNSSRITRCSQVVAYRKAGEQRPLLKQDQGKTIAASKAGK